MKIETKGTWRPSYGAFGPDDPIVFQNARPRKRAIETVTAREAVGFSWRLFWRSLIPAARGRKVDIWLEGEDEA